MVFWQASLWNCYTDRHLTKIWNSIFYINCQLTAEIQKILPSVSFPLLLLFWSTATKLRETGNSIRYWKKCSSNDHETFIIKDKNFQFLWTLKKSHRKHIQFHHVQWIDTEEIRTDWLSDLASNSKFKSPWKWKA